ncbi:MAG TPA: ABC transporter substrate-binding protein [Acetobacteraceae bacterium]|nr:ABC transporter substrate-binding protein [Acetobacteraceae bacterium]
MITRRAALAGALALPAAAGAQRARVLRMVPQTNLVSLDPVWATATVTRNHAFLVYDTLYGLSSALEPMPQMADGHQVEFGGRRAVIFLRDGLTFHDGEKVLARDVVASLNRWMARNPLGQALGNATAGITALDDQRIQITLRRPFPSLFHALGAVSQPAVIMPERIARTDPFKAIEETVGSGPFRFKRDEFVSGSRVVYERNPDYKPAPGRPSLTAGAKIVHFDRVEWHIIPDAGTAAAALQAGEIDWYEAPPPELQALLRRNHNLQVAPLDAMPNLSLLRLNHLHPPFDNPALRRALFPAIEQADYMAAIVGPDPNLYATEVGVYTPGTPSATRAGMEDLLGPRSFERARALMKEAGYAGESMRLIGPTDILAPAALTQVAADMFGRLGFDLHLALSDWGTVVRRRNNKEALDKGGWSALLTVLSSFDTADPGLHPLLRGNGLQGWPGWPTIPELERLRDAWFEEEDPSKRRGLADDLQRVALHEVAFIPVGAYLQLTALRRNLVDRVPGFAIFWGIKPI